MNHWIKYIAAAGVGGVLIGAPYFYPAESFVAFAAGWLLAIPAAFAAYLVYGLIAYRKDIKNRIIVSLKPSEALRAIARREAALKREKEVLYEELQNGMKRG